LLQKRQNYLFGCWLPEKNSDSPKNCLARLRIEGLQPPSHVRAPMLVGPLVTILSLNGSLRIPAVVCQFVRPSVCPVLFPNATKVNTCDKSQCIQHNLQKLKY